MIKKLKELKEFEFRLMPNMHDIKNQVYRHRISTKGYVDAATKFSRPYHESNYCYIKSSDEVFFVKIPSKLYQIITWLMHGDCTINSNGLIIGNTYVTSYDIDKDGNITTFERKDDSQGQFKDIKDIKLIHPFDIRSGYKFTFKYKQIQGYDHFYDWTFIEDKPLYTDDMDRDKFKTDLENDFEHVKDGAEIIKNYFDNMRKETPDLLIDNEINEYIHTKNKMKEIENEDFDIEDIFN